jgi:hypothetical protein
LAGKAQQCATLPNQCEEKGVNPTCAMLQNRIYHIYDFVLPGANQNLDITIVMAQSDAVRNKIV